MVLGVLSADLTLRLLRSGPSLGESAAPVHAINGLRKAGLYIISERTSTPADPELKTQP